MKNHQWICWKDNKQLGYVGVENDYLIIKQNGGEYFKLEINDTSGK